MFRPPKIEIVFSNNGQAICLRHPDSSIVKMHRNAPTASPPKQCTKPSSSTILAPQPNSLYRLPNLSSWSAHRQDIQTPKPRCPLACPPAKTSTTYCLASITPTVHCRSAQNRLRICPITSKLAQPLPPPPNWSQRD